jgi:hypothetical protein
MEDGFELPVVYDNKELNFPARLVQYGYTFKMEVDIEGTTVFFEPDEERNWRAVISYEDVQANKKINAELLKSVAEAIEALTK